jgi:hypothetical protein
VAQQPEEFALSTRAVDKSVDAPGKGALKARKIGLSDELSNF